MLFERMRGSLRVQRGMDGANGRLKRKTHLLKSKRGRNVVVTATDSAYTTCKRCVAAAQKSP